MFFLKNGLTGGVFTITLDRPDRGNALSVEMVERLIAAAQRILHPYTLEVKEVAWWSVYEIGQRICNKYNDVPAEELGSRLPRVFIAGSRGG